MKIENLTLEIVSSIVMLAMIFFIIRDEMNPKVCVEQATVSKILELQYRSALIQLDNGKTIKVDQASLKIGDAFCTRYERKH
jgi:pyruvate carboxylase